MKIIDKINQCVENQKVFYSLEFFPPKNKGGMDNLYSQIDRMAQLQPLFCNVKWGSGGITSSLNLDICSNVQKFCGLEILLYLTYTNMPVDDIRKALTVAKEAGIQNILALRGDASCGESSYDSSNHGFSNAIDLVNFIKKEFGDAFGIAVSGHPEIHPKATDRKSDINNLKETIDAGADFIITPLFYDIDAFESFVKDSRYAGITCPIIPGIMTVQNYSTFKRMISFCKLTVPSEISAKIESIKDNDEAVKEFSIKFVQEMCTKLLKMGCPGLHFYTLNLEHSVQKILSGLNFLRENNNERELPWLSSTLENRSSERIRPIFWANRPRSYLHRTSSWSEFPNGRWGNNGSPAFGDLIHSNYTTINIRSDQDRRIMWGESPSSYIDIYETFANYVDGKIPLLPWCEETLNLETKTIQDRLVEINRKGFLTINSQPQVNGAPSSDPLFGWGGPGGNVYQKAYVECFVSPQNLKMIMDTASQIHSIQYIGVDINGNTYSNYRQGTTALTWGIFPNKEILQPTVMDTESFMTWKDEAFSLWLSMWASCYEKDSQSSVLINQIYKSFFLVSIVDNDFIQGDIWKVFESYSKLSELELQSLEGP